ncbi:hypothetical protein Lser_V15G02871 [Lactuca serriola]
MSEKGLSKEREDQDILFCVESINQHEAAFWKGFLEIQWNFL